MPPKFDPNEIKTGNILLILFSLIGHFNKLENLLNLCNIVKMKFVSSLS